MTWFNAYHLSRPPMVNDPYDPDTASVTSSLRSRAADAALVLGVVVGPLVALATIEAREPATGVARGLGILLLGAAGGQLLFYLPEAWRAWSEGSARKGIALLAFLSLVGAGSLYWGLIG